MKNNLVRLLLLGLLVWVVPFLAAFGFYDSTGKLTTSYDLFKSSMIVIATLVAAFGLYRYFRKVNSDFMRQSWTAGLVWLATNILLDMIILIPMVKMEYGYYFESIGLRYLQIPIQCVTVGMVLKAQSKGAS